MKFFVDKQISYPRHIAPTCARSMRGGWKTASPIWRCNLKKCDFPLYKIAQTN